MINILWEMSSEIPTDVLNRLLRGLTRAQLQVLQIMTQYFIENRSRDVPSHYIEQRYGGRTSVYNILKSLVNMKLVERIADKNQRRVYYRLTPIGRLTVYLYQSMTDEQIERLEGLFIQRIFEYARTSEACDGDSNLANVFSRALARACRIIVLSAQSHRNPMLDIQELLRRMLDTLKSAYRKDKISNEVAVLTAYIISDAARSDKYNSEHYRILFKRIMTKPLDESIQWISLLLRVRYRSLARLINRLFLSATYLVRVLKMYGILILLSLISGLVVIILFFCRCP